MKTKAAKRKAAAKRGVPPRDEGGDNPTKAPLTRDVLINEFKGSIDESLILSLVYDSSDNLNAARDILLVLAKDAVKEEELGFDPTGIPPTESNFSVGAEQSTATSSWADSSGWDEDARANTASFTDFDGLAACKPDDVKLRTAFPSLTDFDIELAFSTAAGSGRKTVEILYREQFNADIGARTRGVNAFYREDGHQIGKSAKKSRPAKATRHGRAKLHVEYSVKAADADTGEQAVQSSNQPARLVTTVSAPEFRRNNSAAPSTGDSPIVEEAWQRSSDSYAAAEAAFKRGQSDPVFKLVGSFYADRGREEAEIAKAAQSRISDEQVAAQSDEFLIDLHGLLVHDGVRVALERATQWWGNLGPGPATKAKRSPFVIVTGLGRHNQSGVSPLRQGVGAALKREGWQYTVEEGRFVLKGKT